MVVKVKVKDTKKEWDDVNFQPNRVYFSNSDKLMKKYVKTLIQSIKLIKMLAQAKTEKEKQYIIHKLNNYSDELFTIEQKLIEGCEYSIDSEKLIKKLLK